MVHARYFLKGAYVNHWINRLPENGLKSTFNESIDLLLRGVIRAIFGSTLPLGR